MAEERKRDYSFEILGAAILLLLLALLCHFHVICPLPSCPEGLISCNNCPGGCCLPDGSCPCPAGSAPCSLYCPETLNCPSGCCNINTCNCVATPQCPPNTIWSESRGCCLFTNGPNSGECATLCSVNQNKVSCPIPGMDACDADKCCPLGSAGWDNIQKCCVDSSGICILTCIFDPSRSGCPQPGQGGCEAPGCCPKDSYWDGKCCRLANGYCADDPCATGNCPPCPEGLISCNNCPGRCCLPDGSCPCPEGLAPCSIYCPQTLDCPSGCCDINTCICGGSKCSDDPSRSCPSPGQGGCNNLYCCPMNTNWNGSCCLSSNGQCAVCPPNLVWDSNQNCCVDSSGKCRYTCKSDNSLVGCPNGVGDCPSSGCCPRSAVAWDGDKKCCVDADNICIKESECTNPEVCSFPSNPCCPGFGCYGGQCKPCNTFTCTNTEVCDCPLGCDCAGSNMACVKCVNPSYCNSDSDCCCGYGCIKNNCIYQESKLVECTISGNIGNCDSNVLCNDGCANGYICTDRRLPEGECKQTGESCSSSQDCCCGTSCIQDESGNGVCCPGGLWSCSSG